MFYKMKVVVVVLFMVKLILVLSDSIYNKDAYDIVILNFLEYVKSGDRARFLNKLGGFNLTNYFREGFDQLALGDIGCTLCETALSAFISERKLGASREFLLDEAVFVCTSLNIEPEDVCTGVIDANIDIILYIIDNSKDIEASKFCSLILQSTNCASEAGYYQWIVDMPEGQTVNKKEPTSDETFNILQLSDFHYDPLYTPGKKSGCNKPLCCQKDEPDAEPGQPSCGFWIDYNFADAPWRLIENTLLQTQTHDFDYIYYTGDIISHRVWETSKESNKRDIKAVYEGLKKSFPDKTVFPVLGNHESHPFNTWTAEGQTDQNLSNQWLFDLLVEQWSDWIPNNKETISRGGYYTISPRPGFRIIALNSNVCYTYNWWLAFDDFDPYGQLKWMIKILLEAEKAKESVHILSHVPPGQKECLKAWSRAYNNIIQRFANTIKGQFNGHTHYDEFLVYYNTSDTAQAINVAYNGASVTTYDNRNPSYKVYTINKENFRVEDFEEWTFNVTQANLSPGDPLPWYKLYSFIKAYGVKNLDSQEIGHLVNRMTSDHSLINQYFKFKSRMADPALVECDDDCKKSELCSIVTHISGDNTKCEEVKNKYDEVTK